MTKKMLKRNILVIFKLIISILYFIISLRVIGIGLITTALLLGGDYKSSIISFVAALTLIVSILCIVLLVLNVISTFKYFKNKYSKVRDIIINILFIILNILSRFFITSPIITILMILFSIFLIVDIIFIVRKKINVKKVIILKTNNQLN